MVPTDAHENDDVEVPDLWPVRVMSQNVPFCHPRKRCYSAVGSHPARRHRVARLPPLPPPHTLNRMARHLIGIDLGTTNSALAAIDLKPKVKAGRPDVRVFAVPQ